MKISTNVIYQCHLEGFHKDLYELVQQQRPQKKQKILSKLKINFARTFFNQ